MVDYYYYQLDIETVEGLIEGLNNYNRSIMMVTHDPALIEGIDSSLYLLEDNKINCLTIGDDGSSWEMYKNKLI